MENQKNMVVAEVQLIHKSKVKASDRPTINKSQDAFRVLKNHWNLNLIDFLETSPVLMFIPPFSLKEMKTA